MGFLLCVSIEGGWRGAVAYLAVGDSAGSHFIVRTVRNIVKVDKVITELGIFEDLVVVDALAGQSSFGF